MIFYFFVVLRSEQRRGGYPTTYIQANSNTIPLPYLEEISRGNPPIQYSKPSLLSYIKKHPIINKEFDGDYISYLNNELENILKDLKDDIKFYYPSMYLCQTRNLEYRLSTTNIGNVIVRWNCKLSFVDSNSIYYLLKNIQELDLTSNELSRYKKDIFFISKVLKTLLKFTPMSIDKVSSNSFYVYHNNLVAAKFFEILSKAPMNIILQNINDDINSKFDDNDQRKELVQDSIREVQNQLYKLSQETKIYFESINEMNTLLEKLKK
ncbi:uncharacterized protein VNE69_10117 [Vairimorpha necatrix]|uniref:Uncharacterized protein n=1 Tax=Vairimorpha necatrix TaxID=6039 RepID=A0AAX4JFS5_9MICR